jgi:hypothetical protein
MNSLNKKLIVKVEKKINENKWIIYLFYLLERGYYFQ